MANAHPTDQFCDGRLIKDISDHTVGFALKESALGTTGHDTTRILSPVLQQRETFRDLWCCIDRCIMKQQP